MAVTAARMTPERSPHDNEFEFTVKTGETIYEGSLCVLDASGELNAATTGTGFVGGYIATKTVTSAAAGTKLVVKSGIVVKLENGDSITKTSIGDAAYAFSNDTVKKTATGLSVCGYIEQVDSDGVWVRLMPILVSGLAAANNLSDVGSDATARLNIKANRLILSVRVPDLRAATNYSAYVVYPVTESGTIKKIYSVIEGAITGGDQGLVTKINTNAITSGGITITQSGSAAGDIDVATPSAANVIDQGEAFVVEVDSGGAGAANVAANVSAEIWT